MKKIILFFRIIAVSPVYFYKLFISPLLTRSCRYTPTCSIYCIRAVKEFGVIGKDYFSTFNSINSEKEYFDMDEVEISASCEKRDMIENMKVAFKKLNKYEQYVVDHYILRNEPLGKIAKAMKTNNAKVQEIHASAINKMRSYVNA